jgi:hypothetical protein
LPLSTFEDNSQASTTNFGIIRANSNGQGVLGNSGSQINQQLANWIPYFSPDAKVIGISFGAGSGSGNDFTGFVDNVRVSTSGGDDAINFEVPTPSGAVPEPASWAMMVGGFGLVGAAMRSRRKQTISYA